ncbi:L-rhamnose mutarotase [Clostridium sp. Marseille-Q2269]|uniref:L-rhamnose mutarotase n=1 Tax=Clostridium sp. Marseille-Q2269 TaxID=2942205 RepID=UPI0020740526|nr:L-rhamnose mutarotase [Clostridium sp. Marseille-Q2269]
MGENKRFGSITRVKSDKLEYYKKLHVNPRTKVNAMIKECNISNYSIYYWNGYLFSYFEYTGDDFEEDMAKMAQDEETQRWWKETDPCQDPITDAGQWLNIEEVYHLD